MKEQDQNATPGKFSRRDFIQTVAASGAGLMLSQAAFAQTTATQAVAPAAPAAPAAAKAPAILKHKGEVINVGIIGVGAEGRVLIDAAKNIPYVRFKAVCDIWEYNRRYGQRYLKAYKHQVEAYEDYKEMLANKEKLGLDAVIVATPDWVHHEHSIAVMEAGLDCYCEKEMSNTLENARKMVEAKNRTGRLLQIGHQRRSNPRYLHAVNNIVWGNKVLGRITHANGQWNRSKSDDLGWPKGSEMSPEQLAKYGYNSMHEFRNWRWFKKFGGGPIVDLGSHQIDIFSWIFKNNPKSVIASGGADFYNTHEWFDNVMCIFEYDAPEGVTRAFYQVLTTTGNGGYFESFMGVDGSLIISESDKKTKILREAIAPDWEKWINAGVIKKPAEIKVIMAPTSKTVGDARETKPPEEWQLPIDMTKPYHQPHLENFFEAMRTGTPLTCPAEVGYETAVAVLAVNKAVETNQKIIFKPEDFHA